VFLVCLAGSEYLNHKAANLAFLALELTAVAGLSVWVLLRWAGELRRGSRHTVHGGLWPRWLGRFITDDYRDKKQL
jgi:hypothetical protein